MLTEFLCYYIEPWNYKAWEAKNVVFVFPTSDMKNLHFESR